MSTTYFMDEDGRGISIRPFLTVEVDVDDLRLHLKKLDIHHPYKKLFECR